ncbi:sodium-dependent bicarbonate transport family permease [Bernardetia sp. ABR2-2B]|uniref:sodium-dependent bicarbonate transport family permease n=1 Tax=Bernardetia sp. ABR2-2B TaxID=3127472 RepID=UPI0030CD5417
MNLDLLISNLTNPTLLFFVLGIFAVKVKSDLEIPAGSVKFISLYLLFAIGFKGGQELSHSEFDLEILFSLLFGIFLSVIVPLYTFFILKRKLSISDAGAIAASYGSVSAVTFVAAASFLELQNLAFGGHMVAVMALMEAPAIVVGVALIMLYNKKEEDQNLSYDNEEIEEIDEYEPKIIPTHDFQIDDTYDAAPPRKISATSKLKNIIIHSFTNGSVLMVLGSLIIGLIADEKQAEGIKPFTTDIFKGFLAIFLLAMGIESGKKLSAFLKSGWFAALFAVIIPIFNGSLTAVASGLITDDIANRFIFAILAASASYIAVPAAMKIAVPQANSGLFIPMALAVTFPFNITVGMPIYFMLIQ